MATGTPTYPTTLDTNASLGPTTGIVAGVTATSATGTNQGDLLGIVNNLINQVIALQTVVGVNASAVTTSLAYKAANVVCGQATINFGSYDSGAEDQWSVTVPATWVTATSYPQVALAGGPDHPQIEDQALEHLSVFVGNLVIGASFDIIIVAPFDTWGQYYVNYWSNIN